MPRLDFAYAGIKFKSSYFNMALKGDYKNMINNERLSGKGREDKRKEDISVCGDENRI